MAFQVNKPMGFSKEQSNIQKDKYDQKQNDQVCDWINRVLGQQLLQKGNNANYLQNKLSNGVLLCNFMNKLAPNSVNNTLLNQKIGLNIFDMQRIAAFNTNAKLLGLPAQSSFEGGDLRDNNNMTAVLIGLYTFGRMCHNKNIQNSKGGIKSNPNKGSQVFTVTNDDPNDNNNNSNLIPYSSNLNDKPKAKKRGKGSRKMKAKKCKTCGGTGHTANFCPM